MAYWKKNYPEMFMHFSTARYGFSDRAGDFSHVPHIDTSYWRDGNVVPKGLTIDDIFPK